MEMGMWNEIEIVDFKFVDNFTVLMNSKNVDSYLKGIFKLGKLYVKSLVRFTVDSKKKKM